jgi:hypothetical protein
VIMGNTMPPPRDPDADEADEDEDEEEEEEEEAFSSYQTNFIGNVARWVH